MKTKVLNNAQVLIPIALLGVMFSFSGHSQVKEHKPAARAENQKQITIGSVPMLGVDQTRQKFEPLLKHLEKAMPMKVDMVVPGNWSELNGMLVTGQVDFAYTGPMNYVDAHKLAGAEVLAVELSPEGKPGYYAILFTSRKSGIKTLDQAKGKVFAFTDKDSTSGFLVPNIYFLRERKQTIASFALRTEMAGSHLAAVEGVLKGKYDVAATNDMDLARAASTLKLSPGQFNVIWKSELIPGAPFVAGKNVRPEVRKQFLEALLAFNADKSALKKMQIGGYAPAKDIDFDVVRELSKYAP